MSCPVCNSTDELTVLRYDEYPLYIKPVPYELRESVPLKPLVIGVCSHCGHTYQKDPITHSEISEIYERVYASYHSPAMSGIGSTLAQEFLLFLEQNIDLKEKKALEIGCYDGYFLSLLRDRHQCRIIGCDPSPGAEIAKRLKVEVIQDYFSTALFQDEFDIIVLRGVLEHIPELIRFLRETREVLIHDGCIALEVPNVLYSLRNGVIGDFFHEHISYFTRESLTNSLTRAGYRVVSMDDTAYYIRAVAQKDVLPDFGSHFADSTESIPMLRELFRNFNNLTNTLTSDLRSELAKSPGKTIYIYGGGGHTIGLISNTKTFLQPQGVIDGDPSKEGKYILGFNIPVYSRKILSEIEHRKCIIIVSSKIFQKEIFESLREYLLNGLEVITLYPTVERRKNLQGRY